MLGAALVAGAVLSVRHGGAALAACRASDRQARLAAFLVAVLALVGTGLRLFWVEPGHLMYVDEPWHVEAARRLVERGTLSLCEAGPAGLACGPYPKAPGWPVLVALWSHVAGSGGDAAIRLATLLGVLAVPLAAALARVLGGGWPGALVAAGLVTLDPLHVRWSATAEATVPGASVLLGATLALVLAVRRPSAWAVGLAASLLGVAVSVRPESLVLLPPAIAMVAHARASVRLRLGLAVLLAVAAGLGALASWRMAALNLAIHGERWFAWDVVGNATRELLRSVGPWTAAAGGLLVLLAWGAGMRRPGPARWVTLASLALGIIGLSYRQPQPRLLLPGLVLAWVLVGRLVGPALAGLGARWRWAPASWLAVGLLPIVLAVPGLGVLRGADLREGPQRQAVMARVAAAPEPGTWLLAEWPTVLAAEGVEAMSLATALADEGAWIDRQLGQGTRIRLFVDKYCEPAGQPGGYVPTCRTFLRDFRVSPSPVEDGRLRYGTVDVVARSGSGP